MKLTLQQLVDLEACKEQRIFFAEHFGDKVEITEELCAEVASDFNWGWAAGNLLNDTVCSEYNRAVAPAWDEYHRAVAPAWDEYNRAVAPARAEYLRAIAPALAECNRAVAPALAEYLRAIAPAMAECNRTITHAGDEYLRAIAPALAEFKRVEAVTFARLYNDQG